jgi:hypothetical protein
MDGARIAALDELSTDDTHLFRVRSVGDGDRPGDDADEREASVSAWPTRTGPPTTWPAGSTSASI